VQNDKFIDQTPQSLTHFDFRVTTESEWFTRKKSKRWISLNWR
jgi:hypothetical protein